MVKKIFFILASILQIISIILILMNLDVVVTNELKIFNQNGMSTLITENGMKKALLFISAIQIILNLFILEYAIKDELLRKKGKVIAISVICFISSISSLNKLLSLSSFIVILCLKRTNPEDFPEKTPEIPSLMPKNFTTSDIILGLSFTVLYFSSIIIKKIDFPENTLLIIAISYYIMLFLLGIICIIKIYKNDIITFLQNEKAYKPYVLKRLGIMYAIYFSVSMFIAMLTNNAQSLNQLELQQMPIWLTSLLAIIWAPIVEELLFRGLLRQLIPHNYLYIIFSGLLFGILHTISEATLSSIILLAIPYSILGCFFAYIYVKTNNITNNILAHCFHNTIGVLALLLFS